VEVEVNGQQGLIESFIQNFLFVDFLVSLLFFKKPEGELALID
jgi:hypothetical protein